MCERDMFSNIGVHTMEPEVFMFLRCLFGFKFTPDRFLIGYGRGTALSKGAVAVASPLVLGAPGLPAFRWWCWSGAGFFGGLLVLLDIFVVWVLNL